MVSWGGKIKMSSTEALTVFFFCKISPPSSRISTCRVRRGHRAARLFFVRCSPTSSLPNSPIWSLPAGQCFYSFVFRHRHCVVELFYKAFQPINTQTSSTACFRGKYINILLLPNKNITFLISINSRLHSRRYVWLKKRNKIACYGRGFTFSCVYIAHVVK